LRHISPFIIPFIFLFSLSKSFSENDPAILAPSETLFFVSCKKDVLYDFTRREQSSNEGMQSEFRRILKSFSGAMNVAKKLEQKLSISLSGIENLKPHRLTIFITRMNVPRNMPADFDLNIIIEHDCPRARAEEIMGKVFAGANERCVKSGVYQFNGIQVHSFHYLLKERQGIVDAPKFSPQGKESVDTERKITPLDDLYAETSFDFQYALMNNLIFICEGEEHPIRNLLKRQMNPQPADSLSGNNAFHITGDETDSAAADVYVDLENLFGLLLESRQGNGGRDYSGFGLSSFKALGLHLWKKQNGYHLNTIVYAPPPRDTLAHALFRFRQADNDLARLIPPDAVAFGYGAVDVAGLYYDLLDAFSGVYPDTVLTIRQTIIVNSLVIGLDVEHDLLGALEGGMGYYLRKPGGAGTSRHIAETYYFKVKDPDNFEDSLRRFLKFVDRTFLIRILEGEYKGSPYWLALPRGPNVEEDAEPLIALCLKGRYLVVSNTAGELMDFIQRTSDDKFTTNSLHPALQGLGGNPIDGERVAVRFITSAGYDVFSEKMEKWKQNFSRSDFMNWEVLPRSRFLISRFNTIMTQFFKTDERFCGVADIQIRNTVVNDKQTNKVVE